MNTERNWEQFALLLLDVQRDFWSEQLAPSFPDFPANVDRLLSLCRSEGLEVGKTLDEALEVWENGLDLCLLKHHLRDPYSVRIRIFPPGKLTPAPTVPGEKRFL